MVSWVVVGSTRGIGFEFVNQLSKDEQNTVFALIRSQNTAGPLNELAEKRKNIHVLETDTGSVSRLAETAEQVSKLNGGKLDVLIYNAYAGGTENMMLAPSAFTGKQEAFENELLETLKVNVFQLTYAINAYLPLIRKGAEKKIIYISSGNGDVDVIRTCELPQMLGYSVSKAAGNIMIAKFAAELKQEGIKTLSLSPGWVNTDAAGFLVQNQEVFQFMLSAFQKLDPNVKGMISTEKSVHDQLKVIASLDESKSGAFLSQHGNREWF